MTDEPQVAGRRVLWAGFSVGERVIIRYGMQQGQKATIIASSRPGDAYRVRAEDGTVHFFSSKGLEKETAL